MFLSACHWQNSDPFRVYVMVCHFVESWFGCKRLPKNTLPPIPHTPTKRPSPSRKHINNEGRVSSLRPPVCSLLGFLLSPSTPSDSALLVDRPIDETYICFLCVLPFSKGTFLPVHFEKMCVFNYLYLCFRHMEGKSKAHTQKKKKKSSIPPNIVVVSPFFSSRMQVLPTSPLIRRLLISEGIFVSLFYFLFLRSENALVTIFPAFFGGVDIYCCIAGGAVGWIGGQRYMYIHPLLGFALRVCFSPSSWVFSPFMFFLQTFLPLQVVISR